MKKQYGFKQGFEGKEGENISLTMKLSVLTENIGNEDVYRLITALDTEYRKLEMEKCGEGRKEFKEWQMVFD